MNPNEQATKKAIEHLHAHVPTRFCTVCESEKRTCFWIGVGTGMLTVLIITAALVMFALWQIDPTPDEPLPAAHPAPAAQL